MICVAFLLCLSENPVSHSRKPHPSKDEQQQSQNVYNLHTADVENSWGGSGSGGSPIKEKVGRSIPRSISTEPQCIHQLVFAYMNVGL